MCTNLNSDKLRYLARSAEALEVFAKELGLKLKVVIEQPPVMPVALEAPRTDFAAAFADLRRQVEQMLLRRVA